MAGNCQHRHTEQRLRYSIHTVSLLITSSGRCPMEVIIVHRRAAPPLAIRDRACGECVRTDTIAAVANANRLLQESSMKLLIGPWPFRRDRRQRCRARRWLFRRKRNARCSTAAIRSSPRTRSSRSTCGATSCRPAALDDADKYLAPEYHQHNPNAETGLDGVKAYFRAQNRAPDPVKDSDRSTWSRSSAERDLVDVRARARR